MSLYTILAFTITVIASLLFVAAIIFLGWFLIWKAFLSKFRLVREVFGQGNEEEQQLLQQQQQQQQPIENDQEERQQPHAKVKKVRKD